MTWVCNDGTYEGPVGACVEVPAEAGTPCDDGLFCTLGDACDGAGVCVGTLPNDCGLSGSECEEVVCDETQDACVLVAANEGGACDSGDLCAPGTCVAGVCEPTPIDCSGLDDQCGTGECNPSTGLCEVVPVSAGTPCTLAGLGQCEVAACDGLGACVAEAAADGTPCSDGDICTQNDACLAGVCTGNPSQLCADLYFIDDFTTCAWTLAGDWECGTPTSGPNECFTEGGCLATKLAGDYTNWRDWNVNTATSPAIDLTGATSPVLSFVAFVQTADNNDGFNVKVSTDGTTYSVLTDVSPAYNATLGGESAWVGNQALQGWQEFRVDLSAYAGQTVYLRFGFNANISNSAPGVYIDSVVVAEEDSVPVRIATKALPPMFVDVPYVARVQPVGGNGNLTYSLIHGTNSSWLGIDPTTGELTGIPPQEGVVSFTVRVEQIGFAANYDERTFTLVAQDLGSGRYFKETFDSCSSGWLLISGWECGTPSNVGPDSCRSGSCIGTVLDGTVPKGVGKWGMSLARSPYFHVPATATQPVLQFWAWVDTLAANYHAMRVLAHRLGDTTAVDLGDADPPQTVASGEASWGGARSRYGWHRFTVDLSDFVGETIALVFEQYVSNADDYMAHPGFYIDDVEVLELEEVKPAIIRTPYHDAFVNVEWTFVLEQSGGFIQPVWSIVDGTNHSWLNLDPTTGRLWGMPGALNNGPVSVTVRAEKPGDPSSYDEWTLNFTVRTGQPYFYSGFEGSCSSEWSLTGDWQCGVPVPPGPTDYIRPGEAYGGSQCLATNLSGNHGSTGLGATWVTARSPSFTIPANATKPVAYFRLWVYTWGVGSSGGNLRVVSGSGSTVVETVEPAYRFAYGQNVWGGDHSRSGWMLVKADLSQWKGQTIQLEFGFRASSGLERPGIYIDDVIVMEE